MITPEELKEKMINDTIFSKLEKEIDESIINQTGFYPWEQALIRGEYSIEIRNIIAEKYKANGWNFVYHRTSSENGERPGITYFMFSEKEIDDKYVKNFHKA